MLEGGTPRQNQGLKRDTTPAAVPAADVTRWRPEARLHRLPSPPLENATPRGPGPSPGGYAGRGDVPVDKPSASSSRNDASDPRRSESAALIWFATVWAEIPRTSAIPWYERL